MRYGLLLLLKTSVLTTPCSSFLAAVRRPFEVSHCDECSGYNVAQVILNVWIFDFRYGQFLAVASLVCLSRPLTSVCVCFRLFQRA